MEASISMISLSMTKKIKMAFLPLFAMGPPIYVTQEDMESFAYPNRIEFEEHLN